MWAGPKVEADCSPYTPQCLRNRAYAVASTELLHSALNPCAVRGRGTASRRLPCCVASGPGVALAVMDRAEFLRFARVGAAERLANIQRELEAIYQRFPELRSTRAAQTRNPYTAGVRSAVSGVRAAVEGAVTRRRARLSPEARRRIAEAQQKRWAEYRRNTEQEATSRRRVRRKPKKTNRASRTKK